MKLNKEWTGNKKEWEEAGFKLPQFDVESVARNTYEHPVWVHMGAGNIFRAFPANVQQNILNEGKAVTGIIAVEGFDYEIIDLMYRTHDNLGVLVTLKADGSIEKTLIGSVTEALALNPESGEEWERLTEIFTGKDLQMVSFTITEKGYNLLDGSGLLAAPVKQDFISGPEGARSYIGKVAALLYKRFQAGQLPLAMVSMDNCSHNGDKLYNAVSAYAKAWKENGVCDRGFFDYINDPDKVSFPWSMIDKITPRPDEKVKRMLMECGFEDVETKVTSKNTYVATFVNAEEPQYLVIEDKFPNGRPNLEEGGIIFTDRETVDKVEKMKVCTCLNPLHTALAVYGCLLGYTLIADEMKDEQLARLVEVIGYEEGLPVVADPGILSPKAFIDEVLKVRIPNPFMPDTPQRIATDTSQKLGIRFGETIKAYRSREGLKVEDLKLIPLVLAGWCRYLMGVDDEGKPMELSPDPLLDTVCPYVAGIKLGDQKDFHKELKPVLSNDKIFGVDLYEAGLGELVEMYFAELAAGPGAVRSTLIKYVR